METATAMAAAAAPATATASTGADDARLDEMVQALRAIIGPSDAALSDDRLRALLRDADRDPNKAIDLYFQSKTAAPLAASGAAMPDIEGAPCANEQEEKSEVERPADDASWSANAAELNELLGGHVERAVILDLLQRTNSSLPRAVEIYFAEQGGTPQEQASAASTSESSAQSDEPPEVHPLPHPSLEPLTPPIPPTAQALANASHSSGAPPSSADLESMLQPATYEVTMVDSNFHWQIGNVFGRAVVQWVEPGGAAAKAGIHKSDVLLSFRDKLVNEQNCSAIVQELSSQGISVPSTMRLRRAPEQHTPPVPPVVLVPLKPELVASPSSSNASSSAAAEGTTRNVSGNAAASSSVLEPDGDVVMTPVNGEMGAARGSDFKFGFRALCTAVDAMVDAIAEPTSEKKVIVDLLLRAEFNLDLAVNNFFNESRVVSDFRRVVGFDWDPANPRECMKVEPYHATIPAGPLGLTVENILERTIVVDIKAGGAAERAAVKRSSWLVALNGAPITHLTHKETLRMIETVTRPLELELVVVPQEEYRRLRKQLSMNIRQHKTERPVPEQDRMSFRVFQLKIHQAVLMMPKLIVVALFHHVTSEQLAPLSGIDARDPFNQLFPSHEKTNEILKKEAQGEDDDSKSEMCEERRFLLNLFASIHEYDDKGESIVIRTIQFLGWLAKRCVDINRWVNREGNADTNGDSSTTEPTKRTSRYALMLYVITHVLECMSIIENHATWDVMVNAFKLVINSLSDSELDETIVPMIARLSVSPSPTARILPIALLSLVYPRVHSDVRVQLRGMLDRMGNDDNPLVRRAIASIIGDLVEAAGATSVQWGVQLLEKATGDSHDIVRIFAVKSCMRLAQDLRRVLSSSTDSLKDGLKQTLHLLYCQMVPMVNTYTSDTSWQVRLEAAKSLPAFCCAFGSDYTDVFVDHFVGLVRDPTVEIRRACADAVFDLGHALIQLAIQRSVRDTDEATTPTCTVEEVVARMKQIDIESGDATMTGAIGVKNELVTAAQTKIVRSVLPVTYGLSTDLSVAVRLALAKSVGKSLQLLVPGSYDDLAPIFTQMLDESQDANVRASLLEEMARHCDHSSQAIAPMLVPAIQMLRTSVQWRVRVKFVQCVAAWAARRDGVVIPMEFADATLDMLFDAVYEVRAVSCATLPSLVKSVQGEWMSARVIPKILQCMGATFNGRVTGLMAIESLVTDLKAMGKLQDLIQTVVEECTSKVPNLRFRALRSLSFLVPLLDDAATTETTLEFIRPLSDAQHEVDVDVRDSAVTTIAVLEAHLQGSAKAASKADESLPSSMDSTGSMGSATAMDIAGTNADSANSGA